MFVKIWASSLLVSALCLQVTAHAAVSPALGVQGTPKRSDVQRPSKQQPCGKIDIANTFESSQAIPVDANGNFEVTAQNFNGGQDGSLEFAGEFSTDATPAFKNKLIINSNGPNDPPGVEKVTIKGQLPKGTKCTGPGNKCLGQLISKSGFGNCFVLQQGNQTGKGKGKVNPERASVVGNSNDAAGGNAKAGGEDPTTSTTPSCTAKDASTTPRVSGRHMARLLLADLRNREEGTV